MSGGVLLVNGKPVTETSAATDPVTPVTESHIPSLLRCAHVGQDGLASADELAARIERAGRIVVVDAADEAELERLAQAIGLLGERALPVGAGGLAAPLARVWAGAEQAGTVLVVVTSQHIAARAQAGGGADRRRRPLLDAGARAVGRRRRVARLERRPARRAADKGGVALLLAPEGHADGLDADMVARRLGGLAAAWIRHRGAAGVVATGGDGAREVLRALDAGGIALADEVMGGVPLGTLTGPPPACPS